MAGTDDMSSSGSVWGECYPAQTSRHAGTDVPCLDDRRTGTVRCHLLLSQVAVEKC